jgi:hypothetical protein
MFLQQALRLAPDSLRQLYFDQSWRWLPTKSQAAAPRLAPLRVSGKDSA